MSGYALRLFVLGMLLFTTAAAAEPSVSEDYVLHCSGCHRSDGRGAPGVVPPLEGLAPLLAEPSGKGREYLVRVPGVAHAPLDDARLARLLNWILARFSGVAPIPPYDAAEVGPLRRHPLRDPAAARPVAPAQALPSCAPGDAACPTPSS